MPRLTRLYTRKGDGGGTQLGAGQTVSKDDPRVQAYGSVDELNAQIGAALAMGELDDELSAALLRIQNELFHLGSSLCFREEDKANVALPRLDEERVTVLEKLTDRLTEKTGPLENFVLPGGCPQAAALHVARTVCRRAERAVVTLARAEPIDGQALRYLNRLSDALFAMARWENVRRGIGEPLWDLSR